MIILPFIGQISSLTGVADEIIISQFKKITRALYFTNGLGLTWENCFVGFGNRSSIAIESLNTDTTSDRTGLRLLNGMAIINTDSDDRASGTNEQRPFQIRKGDTTWESVAKNEIAPLQLENSTLLFAGTGNGANNGLVMSRSIGSGIAGSKIIHDFAESSSNSNGRLFLGANLNFVNTDIIHWRLITV